MDGSFRRHGQSLYGEYLLEVHRAEDAVPYLERALQAPPRPGRALADEGRRLEVRELMEKAKARAD